MKIFVGGCNGVGKTTILKILEKEGFNVVHATTNFMAWLGIENDYEQLRRLPRLEREGLLNQFMSELASSADSFVIDSHYSIVVNGETMNSMNSWAQNIDAFVLITAPEEIILERIEKDSKRDRVLFPQSITRQEKVSYLTDFQNHLRKQSKELAEQLNSPYAELPNVSDPRNTQSRLLRFIKTLEL